MNPCVVWALGASADLASTEYAVHQGAVELNPLQQTTIGRVATQAAYTTVGCALDSHLRKSGKTRLAKGLRIALFIGKLGLAVHNVRSVR